MDTVLRFIKKRIILIIIAIACIPLIAMLNPGLPVTHDGQDHVARIANFFRSLTEGIAVPRWAGNLNWGYGHPILMFLYPLPSYIASLFHVIGFSLIDSTKLVFSVAYIASAVTMYLWLSAAWNKQAGIVGALLYTFAPYRFVDMYVRGAIGEHVAFIFLPLICYFLYQRVKKEHILSGVFLSVSVASIVLSHNAIAIMFLPLLLLYFIYLTVFESKNRIVFILHNSLFILLGFGLSGFFWIPAFLEGKYTLRDIVTAGEVLQRFVPMRWFLYSPWNYGQGDQLTKSLGVFQWIGVFASLIYIRKMKETKIRIFLTGALFVLAGTFFIMTSWSRFVWENILLLQKFQFPWRFLSLAVFCAAVLGAISISKLRNSLLIAYCLLLIITTIQMWHPKGYIQRDDSYFQGIYLSTTDTGESSPVWSVRFMEHTPANPMEVISGSASIRQLQRNSAYHKYAVNVREPSRLVENTLFFPGWKIFIDGVATGIQFQDPAYRGLMTFRITEGDHIVEAIFRNTGLRTAADIVSLFSAGVMIALVLAAVLCRNKKNHCRLL